MKKVMFYLLGLGFILGIPFGVDAKTALVMDTEPVTSVESEDGKSTVNTYNVYITTTENEELSSADIGFQYGPAITEFKCGEAGNFKVADEAVKGDNTVTCKFQVPDEGVDKGEKILVGKVMATVNNDAKDEECYINYSYEGTTGKINPPTGVEMPYMIIIGGAVLAAGVYVVTKKKTALFKI